MYIVIEIQTTNGQTTVVTPIFTTDDINTAYNKYYTILAAAAKSTVEVHAAVILSETGTTIANAHFAHSSEVTG